ncbi:pyruvate:ferredoxin (flavodoxin) oxidoreductase [Synechococcus sp. CS-205]|uniref:pyruvate:ferredoxin (flavodoxin) oxidoreductase n=1 Tax=Synechococcus sp. CS-205 TaxID=2847984 RepID=UPI00223C275B|nr:pyruvate:ferredoxin (flavodoxin) oxidoreductase [Synechococcus sp. CS-205]MCT0249084.1 pyruvate:ferredoxin (flavodoxin) oxidoreductase [Synechococcus sp. CS-205]
MTRATLDGNEAVARVAYRLNELMAIYPITPASPMGEWADRWASECRPNLWGTVPRVVEMQSEGGAAGVLHGALQAGVLTTTFTASQGLLLMLPNLYKIAGELTSTVVHVASRALAGQALSIFGDHSDVMAVRGTGCALLCSASVQEAGDFAAIASLASLRSRLPVVHFFDGFRTSHELQTVELIDDDLLRALIPEELIAAHRGRGLSPDHPVIRGTSQNPDVAFQAREAANPFHDAAPQLVQDAMDAFAGLSGRAYQLFEYRGHPQAERVLVLMGSGCETAHETVDALTAGGARVGVLKVRLYRPFDGTRLLRALPATTRAIAVLDRCKEPGSGGEPLYLDVSNALREGWTGSSLPRLLGGRYGLASKEFTPAMVRAVFAALERPGTPNPFSVGIDDDVTHRSLPLEEEREAGDDPGAPFAAILYGLGSDGTVGASKSTVKIIGAATALHAQGYFVYDSKKSGAVTVSHLRFGPEPIRSTHLVRQARLVACHHWDFLERFDLLAEALPGATLLLNSPWPAEQVWARLPRAVQERIVERNLRVLAIEASTIARELGLGGRINTVMQVAFFAAAGVLPLEQALEAIRGAIRHSYGGKGERVVRSNLEAVDTALSRLRPVPIGAVGESAAGTEQEALPDPLASAPAWVHELIAPQLARQGDRLPVSSLPPDGTFPCGTARWEKRNIAESVPVWEADLCVQCGKCVMVCPHAAIRANVVEPSALADAPEGFASTAARDPHWSGLSFTLQVAGEDCTGCSLCVEVCPARDRTEPRRKAINMAPQRPLRQRLRRHWDYALGLPSPDRRDLDLRHIRQQQLQEPLFEFSGACGGCGETPYIKLATQLFGDRMVVANATGCSSIYGGNLPTTPWSANGEGRGPAWSNSLFEDNAEFGLGFRLAFDQRRAIAQQRLLELAGPTAEDWLPEPLAEALIGADQSDEAGLHEQRLRVVELRMLLEQRLEEAQSSNGGSPRAEAARALLSITDDLVKRSVWLIGGDGWAYDIGSAGIDHVLASGADVNILVLDTEVYSNTGGQMSKATPRGAVAKFASGGKTSAKKDLGLMAMSYGHVYVASVAMGARDEHTLRAFLEAESFPGPSLILAYSHCIAHGIDMAQGMTQQKRAVESGRWLLYRHDPRRAERGENPLVLDSRAPSLPMAEAMASENRFRMLTYSHPQQARDLTRQAQQEARQHWERYQRMAEP